MCGISLCTRGALDTWSRGRSTAALGGNARVIAVREKIFGVVGMVWGGALLISGFLRYNFQASGIDAVAQGFSLVSGSMLFLVGVLYLSQGSEKSKLKKNGSRRRRPTSSCSGWIMNSAPPLNRGVRHHIMRHGVRRPLVVLRQIGQCAAAELRRGVNHA